MKKQFTSITLLLSLVGITAQSYGQSELQVIHNCSDPAAATVDIYVNGNLAIDDFAFRTATPFLNLPSSTTINIGVAGGNSTSVNDTLVNFQVSLMPNERYVAVASGVLNPASFAPNPDNVSTSFGLQIKSGINLMGQNPGNVDLIVNHGSIDAPTVDVIARGVTTLVDDARYADITSYISVPAASYLLDITPGNDQSTIVATFEADLTGLAGGTAFVFASGFLDPSQNQNGEAFGLYAALTSGTVVPLAPTSKAEIQVIHNAADPAAALVDIYVDGNLAVDDFAFRSATPFITLDAGVILNVGVAGANSTSVNDTLVNFEVQLQNGNRYIAVANGVLNPSAFALNPDGLSTGFTLFIKDEIRSSALNPSEVDFIVVHGSTDAPTVDVVVSGAGTILVDDAAYSDITPYLSVPPATYTLDITPGNNNSTVVASFTADLSGLGGGSAVVFASGFLDPNQNQNGEAFGLYAALANGTVVPFQLSTGLFDLQEKFNISYFPNPASSGSWISINSDASDRMTVELLNLEGKIVESAVVNGMLTPVTFNLPDLNKGIYLLRVQSSEGSVTGKIVIE